MFSPISKNEFLLMFQRCAPPKGLDGVIAVANSGGPDSTCLLFLINRCIAETENKNGLPNRVVSLTIDHGLQPSSVAMAGHCAKTAASMGVEHLTTPIQWSDAPFPPKPAEGEAVEFVAREARRHVLFHLMTRVGAKMVAFGHHADDQVETSLMRLGRHTTELGAGGMRRCRRWGMGSGRGETSLGWAGYEGMNRWILRPLLDVSKGRILATCEAHGLEYVTDQTNFQPELTLRNAVRRLLATREQMLQFRNEPINPMRGEIAQQLKDITNLAQFKSASNDTTSGSLEQLRGVVKSLSVRVEDIDSQVDYHLSRSVLPSYPGTFLLTVKNLAAIHDTTIRQAMILRILRYVSPYPWGSLRADANRKQTSIRRIVEDVWNPDPWLPANRKAFTAGGGVQWTPVLVGKSGRIKFPKREPSQQIKAAGKMPAWLASRQPPSNKDDKTKPIDPLFLDVTDLLAEKIASSQECGEVLILYDCRFLLRFDIAAMPSGIARSLVGPQRDGRISIEPRSQWYLPSVFWQREGERVMVADMGQEPSYEVVKQLKTQAGGFQHKRRALPIDGSTGQGWVKIECARSIKEI